MAMSPEQIAAKFAAATDDFEPIAGKPAVIDLTRIRKALMPLLLMIPFDETNGKHNLVGIIQTDEKYQQKYGTPFPVPGPVAAYDAAIKTDATNVERSRGEYENNARRADRTTYVTAVRETAIFIRAAVEETWYLELLDEDTFYNDVSPRQLLEHLEKNCRGKHAVDIRNLHKEMETYHLEAEGIPEYINKLEAAQKRVKQAGRTMDDQTLVDFATTAMETSSRYTKADDKWDDLEEADQTWSMWKDIYTKADARLDRKNRALEGVANAAARRPEESIPGGVSGTPSGVPAAAGEDVANHPTLEEMEGFFDNLANAATTENGKFAAAVAELTAIVATLTATNAEMSATVKKLTGENRQLNQEVNALRRNAGGGGRPARAPANRPTRATPRRTTQGICGHCKKVVMHWPEDCWVLPENASKRPSGWVAPRVL